jgi:hypothetical protein
MGIGSPLDQPPFFVWKSDTLDVCDSLDELHDRYPANELAQEGVIVCDSRGRAVWISRAVNGAWINAAEEYQSPSPDLLRSILWKYSEGRGTSPEEIRSLSLDDLIARAYPDDPMEEYRQGAKFHGCLVGIIVIIITCIIAYVLDRWFNFR